MLFLPNDESSKLLAMANSRAVHLEVADDHAVSDEDEPMRRFLAGQPPVDPDNYPTSWRQWEDLVAETTARGVAVQRIRVVTEPLTDYIRFLHAISGRNEQYGEDIRWLPRHTVDPAEYTTDEWWLLDDDILAWTLFDSAGDFVGFAVTRDPVEVVRAIGVRDRLWVKAVRHSDYVPETIG
ncbi:hypothetical protein OH799_27195 [Nocardia sp. NBC_00881]|uniref:DUF6879 family protein n=1 Tax=Nocardia sp. NBC_00881 TaxID=2975995 RepID=UPI0038654E7E|nr:hypothetical protein OH799_27195 [Nocardia sp. NBC_00881]